MLFSACHANQSRALNPINGQARNASSMLVFVNENDEIFHIVRLQTWRLCPLLPSFWVLIPRHLTILVHMLIESFQLLEINSLSSCIVLPLAQ